MRMLIAAGALAVGAAALPLTAAHAGSTWVVGMKASATTTTAGHTVTFTGTVRPRGAAAGEKVLLQEKFKAGKPWVTQRKATISRSGKFKVADKPTANTRHSYRVVMPATNKHPKGVSATKKVTVFGWENLSDRRAVHAHGMNTGTVQINGHGYDDSVYGTFGDTQSAEYNLDHKCLKLRARFGISDGSTTGGQAEVDALSDGTNVYSHVFDLGQSEQKTVALAKPLKLLLSAQSTGDVATQGLGAFASAQVLCTQ
jgi:hypothetical protein